MNNIEELLWNYIDGTCSTEEQKIVSALIKADETVRIQYQEILSLNNEFSAMELNEPSMAFTYNIMETIRTENAQVPLKATINNRIIWGIAAFFILSISLLLIFTMTTVSWSGGNTPINLPFSIKLPDVKPYLTGPVLKGFLFFDVVLGLFLMDAYLRKKNSFKQA
jgi:hypothetical protein